MTEETLSKKAIRAIAFDEGFDIGFKMGVRMSNVSPEDLHRILKGIRTTELLNELNDRVNNGETLPAFKRKYNTFVTEEGIEHMPLECGNH